MNTRSNLEHPELGSAEEFLYWLWDLSVEDYQHFFYSIRWPEGIKYCMSLTYVLGIGYDVVYKALKGNKR